MEIELKFYYLDLFPAWVFPHINNYKLKMVKKINRFIVLNNNTRLDDFKMKGGFL